MRNTFLTILLVVVGFALPIVAVPTMQFLGEAREQHLDIDPHRGEVLFFTADW